MNHRSFRDEVRSAFHQMTGLPHPALASEIRDELLGRPSRGRGLRLAAVLAVALALIVVVGLLTTQRLGAQLLPKSVPAHQTRTAHSPSPSPAVQAPVVPPGTSGATPSPGFTCAATSGGGTGQVKVTAVRAAAQSGYDRFVVQFDGPVPQYELRPQSGSTFVQDASGAQVTLQGSSGLLLTLHNTSGAGSYSGPTDLHPNGSVVREARQVGDFEGVVRWALGLARPGCYRVTTLSSPFRLVIDVQS
jgi:hypothetical protein